MKKIIKSSTGHVIKNYSTGEVVWEGETPMEFPEIAPASCVIDEYDALMRRKYLELHRKLWNYIADEGAKKRRCISKEEAFKHFGWSIDIASYCWACEYYAWKKRYDWNRYHCCPKDCLIDWGKDSIGNGLACVFSFPSENATAYEMWRYYFASNDWIGACMEARKIANLPERKA